MIKMNISEEDSTFIRYLQPCVFFTQTNHFLFLFSIYRQNKKTFTLKLNISQKEILDSYKKYMNLKKIV